MFTASTIHNVAKGEKKDRDRRGAQRINTDSFLFVLMLDWLSSYIYIYICFPFWGLLKSAGEWTNSDYPQIREYDLKDSWQPFPRSCCRRRKPPLLELCRSPNPQAVWKEDR